MRSRLELAQQRVAHEGGAHRVVAERGAEAGPRLARVVDEVEQRGAPRCVEAIGEGALHDGAQAPGAVSQDVLELAELAMHVAHDVDRAARQLEHGAQVGDLGERGVGVAEPVGEGAQMNGGGGHGRRVWRPRPPDTRAPLMEPRASASGFPYGAGYGHVLLYRTVS